MKVYNLCCQHEHSFEGWFASEEDFNAQSAQRLIACPVCADSNVRKLPSAPHLNLSAKPAPAQTPTPAPTPGQDAAARLHAQWMELARKVIANTEDVGENFTEEARRIHYREAPERGIRGVASAEEREALAEEGIATVSFPLPAALKRPLH